MKIRSGFVSNSSSSSFIIFTEKPIQCAADLTVILNTPGAERCDDDESFDTAACARYLWGSSSQIDLSSFIRSTYYANYYEIEYQNSWWRTTNTPSAEKKEQASEDAMRRAQQAAFRLMCEKKHHVYIRSIEDHGSFARLESGEFFPGDTIRFGEH